MFLDWERWKFFIIALLLFVGCIFVNYLLKKFNEARIEERFARLLQKSSKSQGTQMQETGLTMETSKSKPVPIVNTTERHTKKSAGISLVFNKEDNIIHDNNDKIDKFIKNKEILNIAEITDIDKPNLNPNKNNFVQNSMDENIDNSKKDPGTIVIKDSKADLSVLETLTNTLMTKNIIESILQANEINETKSMVKICNSTKDAKLVYNVSNSGPQVVKLSQNSVETVLQPNSNISLEIGNLKSKVTSTLNNAIIVRGTTDFSHASDLGSKISEISQDMQDIIYHNLNEVLNNKIIKQINFNVVNNSMGIDNQIPEILQETIQKTPLQLSYNTTELLEPKQVIANKNIDSLHNVDYAVDINMHKHSIQEISNSSEDSVQNNINTNQNAAATTSANYVKEAEVKDDNSNTVAYLNIKKNWANNLTDTNVTFEKSKGKNNTNTILIDNTTTKKITLKNIPAIHNNLETIESALYLEETLSNETLPRNNEFSIEKKDGYEPVTFNDFNTSEPQTSNVPQNKNKPSSDNFLESIF